MSKHRENLFYIFKKFIENNNPVFEQSNLNKRYSFCQLYQCKTCQVLHICNRLVITKPTFNYVEIQQIKKEYPEYFL